MRFELPSTRKRREILAAPELLRINTVGIKLSGITKILMIGFLSLLYAMFLIGTFQNISTRPVQDRNEFIIIFVVLAIAITGFLVIAIYLILADKRAALIFTDIGIVGSRAHNVKYDSIGAYGWEHVSGILALGQRTKEMRKTLRLRGKGGFLQETAFTDRFGNSVFGNFGYYFDNSQINRTEEIMSGLGINRLPDRTE